MFKPILILLLVSPLAALAAKDPAGLEPLPEPPPPPPPQSSAPPPTGLEDEDMEPDVQIIKRNDGEIHEYRINGRLYMVKVFPRFGPPYVLYDRDGNGSLETRSNRMEPAPVVPNWILHSW
jgi:hypothetical protein